MQIELNFPNPVTTAQDFFDREKALAEIQQTLQSTTRRPIAILGERKTGKTSLLNRVTEWVEQAGLAVVLHLPHAYVRDDLAAEIIYGICFEVGLSPQQTGLLDDQGQFRLTSVNEFVHMLRQLIASKPGIQFVICIDEIDSLLKKCDDTAANEILDFILHLIEQARLPLHFLFTMTQITEQILRSYTSPFLSSTKLIRLAPWNLVESSQFVSWLLQDYLAVDPDIHRQIFAAAGGHPYFTKALLNALLEQVQADSPPLPLTSALVDAAVTDCVSSLEVDFTLANIAEAHLSPPEHQILSGFIATQNGLPEKDLSESGSQYLTAARDLHQRGYLTLQNGVYHLRIGILRRWLKKKTFGLQIEPAKPAALTESPAKAGLLPAAADIPPKLLIDDNQERVYLGDQELQLSSLLYRALCCLGQNKGGLVKKQTLVEAWPDDEQKDGISEASIDQVIRRLREKLNDDANNPIYLKTVRGRGYLLDPDLVVYISDSDL